MADAFSDALDSLIARIVATAPSFDADLGFHSCVDPASGYDHDLESITDEATRWFDFRVVSWPADAGGSGFNLTRFTVGLELRVRYPSKPRARSDRQSASDTPLLINALIHPAFPLPWHDSIEAIETGRATGADVGNALIVRHPFTMHYRDAQES